MLFPFIATLTNLLGQYIAELELKPFCFRSSDVIYQTVYCWRICFSRVIATLRSSWAPAKLGRLSGTSGMSYLRRCSHAIRESIDGAAGWEILLVFLLYCRICATKTKIFSCYIWSLLTRVAVPRWALELALVFYIRRAPALPPPPPPPHTHTAHTHTPIPHPHPPPPPPQVNPAVR